MKQVYKYLSVMLVATLSWLLPINVIIGGSGQAMLTWSSICAPVLAVHAGMSTFLWFCLSWKLLTFPLAVSFLLQKLPLFCSVLAFRKSSVYISLLLPAACMMLFILHPVGQVAWLYSLYWLIPMALYFVSEDADWKRAVIASFASHAVGSVMYLYTTHMSAAVWMALMPVVAVERLLISVGIVVVHRVVLRLLQQNLSFTGLKFRYKEH